MNKFIKLPLFLGATCLIAGGLLTGVVALTDPIIENARLENLAKAFKQMYQDDSASLKGTPLEIENNDYLKTLSIVDHKNGTSYVYLCNSISSYEKLTFYVGISLETKAIDSYHFLETTKSSFGYDKFKDSDNITSLYEGYKGKDDIVISGVTFTSGAVKKAIDIALADFNGRVN